MLIGNPIAINVLVCIMAIVLSLTNDQATAARCSRIPEGFGAKRTVSPGNFRIRLSDDSGLYKPGKAYTVWIERNSNSLRSRDRPRQTFTGFYLAVEQKKNTTSEFSEDFSPVKHGTFKLTEEDTLAKMICGNVVMHTSDASKTGVQVMWTAPEAGSGCVTFRATIVEHRDVWYMDDGPLSKDFCEDEEAQEDFITNVLEECCACYEAKYELTFEGLWSRNTHPKGFPRNVYITKFGDIIGATHKIGTGFWANGEFASDGLREVAEIGSTRTLESELKNKSDSIRTIIKARGLSHPNITGKTFAVFRVDSIHHLVSFVSMISPSPDWFVGISGLELCQADCTWLENKIIELYPWDAGTDKGTTYDSPDQPSRPQDYIRRITSESPNNNDSPFFNPNGQKMKPLARLTLLRQRLYEKNCTAEQTASDECQVSTYDAWGECTGACGGTGKKYRHRYYKNSDRASKCHRKLFETKSCRMAPCKHDENENDPSEMGRDNIDDPMCKGSWGEWSSCQPKCKTRENEVGKRKRDWKYEKGFHKLCNGRARSVESEVINCEIDWCVAPSSQEENQVTESNTEDAEKGGGIMTTEEPKQVDCRNVQYGEWKFKGPCSVTCGSGIRNRTRKSYNPDCEDIFDEIQCNLSPCKNREYCSYVPNLRNCQRTDTFKNFVFFNDSTCSCNEVFTTTCRKNPSINMFETPEECREACPEASDNGCESENAVDSTFDASPPNQRRPPYRNRNRN